MTNTKTSKEKANPSAPNVTVNAAATAAEKQAKNPPNDNATTALQNTGGAQESKTEAVVHVVGPKNGRYRAGRHFGPTQTTILRKNISAKDLAALHADPQLLVIEA